MTWPNRPIFHHFSTSFILFRRFSGSSSGQEEAAADHEQALYQEGPVDSLLRLEMG